MRYVLALDQGTTSSRAIVFDRAGTPRGAAQREFQQIYPQPGWVEHDPVEIWTTQARVMHDAVAAAGLRFSDIAALGITNQRETTLLWDRATGRPVANAIVWQDRRTADRCDALRVAGHAALFTKRTGLVLDPYFSGTKLAWLLDHVDGARERARLGKLAFGTVDSWLVWNLTGGAHMTDVSNASRTLLFDIHAGEWDEELLALLDIPRSVLPQVVSSSGECAKATIDGIDVPIGGIAGDQQAALFGQACLAPGLAKNTYGTGCFMLLNTGESAVASANNLLSTVAWRRHGASMQYALEGSVFIGGAVVQWLRDGLRIVDSAAAIEALAASVEDNGGVVFVPAFAGLGAPHWDAYARGAMFGLTRGVKAGHIARAALEAIAFQCADLLQAMQRDAGITLSELRVDGGAAANNLLMQFQSDVLGVPVVRPKVLETTALGAAYLAGLAVGYWEDAGAIRDNWRIDRSFEPSMSGERAQELRARWDKAIARARDWAD
jgi:glycerol kinase